MSTSGGGVGASAGGTVGCAGSAGGDGVSGGWVSGLGTSCMETYSFEQDNLVARVKLLVLSLWPALLPQR